MVQKMFRNLFAAGVAATAFGLAGAASAATWVSELEYRDTGASTPAKSSTPYGEVTIEDGIDFGKTVKVTVTLTNPDSLFVNTGGPHDPFLYNLLNAADVEIINGKDQNFYDGGRTDPGTFEAVPFGDFTNKIGCCSTFVDGQNVVSGFHFENQTSTIQVITGYKITGYKNGKPIYDKNQPIYGTQQVTTKVKVLDYTWVPAHYVENNGAANGIKGPLTFYLHDSKGITFAGLDAKVNAVTGKLDAVGTGPDNHFYSNKGGWWFTADICDRSAPANACTYNVGARDARLVLAQVPEPATWALMILGFGGAGAMLRRRRAAHA